MESKTLNAIQIFAKIGRVMSIIVRIVCIVGAILSLVSLISLATGAPEVIKVGGVSVYTMIPTHLSSDKQTLFMLCTVSLILCSFEGTLAQKAAAYFKRELMDGTPFTFDGAKELLHLGIWAIVVPILAQAVSIAVCVGMGISRDLLNTTFDFDLSSNISIGIIFIFMSLICKYGAECFEKDN